MTGAGNAGVTVTLRATPFTYRVGVNPGDGDHVTGTSPTRRLGVQMG